MRAEQPPRPSAEPSTPPPARQDAARSASHGRAGALHGDGAAPWGQSDARLARTGFALRRLRYFGELLRSGLAAARAADLPSGTLRSERIALAIDRPELDTVALWTTRRDDGTVAIPFVEYLLGQFIGSLEMFLAELPDAGAAAEVATLSQALDLTLRETNRRGEQALALPVLGDSFLPEPLLERLCGRDGLIDRTVRCCESLLGEAH